MARAAQHQSSDNGRYTVSSGTADHALTISASGPDRGTALAAALTGLTAAILGHEPPSPVAAAVAVPLRADGPDFPSLVPALAASLFESLDDDPALIGPIRIDGILRTDEGLTAWGYMLTSSTPAPPAARFTIDHIDVNDTEGDVTIRLQLARES